MAKILGLDIGVSTLRGVLVRTSIRRMEVVRYVQVPLVAAPDSPSRAGALREAARGVLAALGTTPDGVIVAMPGEDVSLRVVELPAAAARRVDEVLPFELENVLPFPVEEAVVDHQPIGTVAGKLRLLAGAARRERVGALLASLREATVDPRELAVGAAALDGLVGVVPPLEGAGAVLVADVGERETAVCILARGRAEMARTLSVGWSAIPRSTTALVRGLQQTVISYRAAGGPELRGCYLSGGAGRLRDLAPWVQTELGVEVQPLPMPQAPGADDATRLDFARALALAGRAGARGKRLDLRRGEFATKRTMGALRQHGALIAGCAAAVFVAFTFSTYAAYASLDARRAALAEELERVTEDTLGEKTSDVTRARELLDGQRGPADPLPKFDAFDTLDAITAAVPPEITHDTRRLVIEIGDEGRAGHFELQGSVSTIGERDRIAQELEKHRCFRELERGRTTPAVGQDRLNYQIEADIQCPGEGRTTQARSTTRGSQ